MGIFVATAEASHTHLFPGAVVKVHGSGAQLVVTFSDGASAAAEIVDDGGKPALVVEAYTTSSGTVIPRKMWFVSASETEGAEGWLKVGRAVVLE
ncbi:hypothetical protein [Arthrobacter sp. D5-1]|uniref:hypothetical protein n=1 Tax=Arthrobacter sp. D5-1 TaxID=1477518 RepID=UPI001A999D5E|nr:hypothetical protein [Arthrobacter sp. D5-1]QSZ47020.1 hypothetical protein AYX22_00360 [Arthrobacter sp. D5-1]